MLVLSAMGGTTGWHYSITRNAHHAFPGTVPTLFILDYVQAHHLDLEFYDRFFEPGSYLRSHADHMQRWHA